MNKTIRLAKNRYGYGIPNDLIKKNGSFWLPIGNVKFRNAAKHRRRHHYKTCPVCGEEKKNIRLHYRKYHPKFWEEHFIKPFKRAQIGEISGVRFIQTKRVKGVKTR